GLAATLASIAVAAAIVVAVARKRGAGIVPRRSLVVGAGAIGALAIATFVAGGAPRGVGRGVLRCGAPDPRPVARRLSDARVVPGPGPKHALADSILSDTTSLADLGMILGAMAAAAAGKPFARASWPPLPSLAAAVLGGLLMGWGARLGFGCNIGAFV